MALCKRCLAPEPADRPADGDVVAPVAALRAAADDRARQAELDRHAAEVQAAEQRKRRRILVGLAVALLVGIAATTVGLLRAKAREAETTAVLKFFEDKVFAAARPQGQDGGLGKDVTLREAIIASLPALDTDFQAQPLVERLRVSLAATLLYLGNPQPWRTPSGLDRSTSPTSVRTMPTR